MLFLLNDVILTIEGAKHTPRIAGRKLKALNFNAVSQLGQELYADEPLLHRTHHERACRLASLIIAKAPAINAALFVSPRRGCSPSEVTMQYCHVDFELMARMVRKQVSGELDALCTDREVWRRLAA
jgi:hypothetical protein